MNLSPFQWLRSRIRAAILDGVADAIAAIDTPSTVPETALPEALAARLRPCLTSSEPEETNGKRKKGATS